MLVSRMLHQSSNDTSFSALTVSCLEGASKTPHGLSVPAGDAVRLLEDACQGVEHLHAVGLLHRGLNRGILLVTRHPGVGNRACAARVGPLTRH